MLYNVDVLQNLGDGSANFFFIFFIIKEGYKVFCVKMLIFCWLIRSSVFIWNIAYLTHWKIVNMW